MRVFRDVRSQNKGGANVKKPAKPKRLETPTPKERAMLRVGNMIRSILSRKKITQAELSRRMGKPDGTEVNNVINGRENIGIKRATAFGLALNMSYVHFLKPYTNKVGRR